MSSDANYLSILPLENLPEPVTPPQKSYIVRFLEVSDETQVLLDRCDWAVYETSIIEGLREAIKKYRKATVAEKISQVSIATNPDSQFTEISFETKCHALAHIQECAKWSRERGLEDMAETLEKAGYNTNPADFQYSKYYTILHRELKPLDWIDYSNFEDAKAANVWIETALFNVLQRVQALSLLEKMPSEGEILLGVNSAHSWYDHVTKIKVQQ